MSTTSPTETLAAHLAREAAAATARLGYPPSFDQRAYQDKIRRAGARYVDAYGEPPTEAAFSPSVTAQLDACEVLGGGCDRARAWLCHGAHGAHDGRCACGCHRDERPIPAK